MTRCFSPPAECSTRHRIPARAGGGRVYSQAMARLLLEIFRFPSDRQLSVISYYVLLDHRPRRARSKTSPEVPVSGYRRPISSTDNRTAIAQPTPDAAIREMQEKLGEYVLPGDTIEYLGEVYSGVPAVIEAVIRRRPEWE